MIEEMNLPASLETLGMYALYYCKGLKKVTLSPKMTTIESDKHSVAAHRLQPLRE
jgi:hypothetical protein